MAWFSASCRGSSFISSRRWDSPRSTSPNARSARDHSIKRLLDPKEELRSVFVRWNSAFALFVFALFMIQATEFYSRGSVIAQYAAGLVAAGIVRLVIMRAVARGLQSGRIRGRKAVIVGEQNLLDSLVPRMSRAGRGASVVDVIALEQNFDLGPVEAVTEDFRVRQVGRVLAKIHEIARQTEVDDIVLALSWTDKERIRALTEGLASVPATIHLAPDENLGWVREPVLARVGGDHTLRLSRAPLTLKDHFIKRIFDVSASIGLLLIASPVLALDRASGQVRFAGTGAVPSAAQRIQPARIPRFQIPHHVDAR